MSALAKAEACYSHIEWREGWGDIKDPNSFARRYYAHQLWFKDKNQEGARCFECGVEERLPIDLIGVDLRGASLVEADLSHSVLKDADLRYTDMKYANLKSTNMMGTKVDYADLSGANMENSVIDLLSLKEQTKLWNGAILTGVVLHKDDMYFTENDSRKVLKRIAKEHGINARGLMHSALVSVVTVGVAGAMVLAVAFNNSALLSDENKEKIALMCSDKNAVEILPVADVCRELSP